MASNANEIAKLFASIGFKVDLSTLTAFENTLKSVEKRVTSFSATVEKGTAKAQMELKRSLDIEGKKARLLTESIKQNLLLAKIEVERARQQVITARPALALQQAKLRLQQAEIQNGTALTRQQTAQVALQRQQLALETARARAEGRAVPQALQPRSGLLGFAGTLLGGPMMGIASSLMPIVSAAALIREGINSARSLQSSERALQVITGSEKKGSEEFSYITAYANRMGLSAKGTAEQYAQMMGSAQGTKLAGDPARKIFEGFTTYGQALHLTPRAMEGQLYALREMMSKGQIYSSELNRQMGTWLPGAKSKFAQAMGMSPAAFSAMMKDGKAMSADILPKVAEFLEKAAHQGGALEKALQNSQSEATRLRNHLELAAKTLYDKGFDRLLAILTRSLTGVVDIFTRFVDLIGGPALAFAADLFQGLTVQAGDFSDMISSLVSSGGPLFQLSMLIGAAGMAGAIVGWERLGVVMGTIARRVVLQWLPVVMIFGTIMEVMRALEGKSGLILGYNKAKPWELPGDGTAGANVVGRAADRARGWLQQQNEDHPFLSRINPGMGLAHALITLPQLLGDTIPDQQKPHVTPKDWNPATKRWEAIPQFLRKPQAGGGGGGNVTIHINGDVHTIHKTVNDAMQMAFGSLTNNSAQQGIA